MTDAQIMELWRCYNPPPGNWKPILDFAHALLDGRPLPEATLEGHDFRYDRPSPIRKESEDDEHNERRRTYSD